MIKGCDNARDLGTALVVLAEMEAAGVPPNVVTFTALIKACDNAGDRGKAVGVRAEMKAARVPPIRTSSPSD